MRHDLWKRVCAVFLFCAANAIASSAQVSFTTLLNFNGTDGTGSSGALVQGSDGNFYGTGSGGANSRGTVYKITPSAKLTRLHSFCTLARCADGESPLGALVQGSNGKFYGTALTGGSGPDGCGTVFEITAVGEFTTLHIFEGTDGCGPYSGLVQAADGNFYGTTYVGGVNSGGGGTVFKITAAGEFTSLYSFCSLPNCADGDFPLDSLVQGNDGNLYGTTAVGGDGSACSASLFPEGCGTVFKITPNGKLTTLYSFCSLPNCADGSGPEASLIQASNGNFYGTTPEGGANCSPYGCGTAFEITPAGKLTTLYSFCSLPNCADGYPSYASLVQATDGNFYGTTSAGGVFGEGSIFEMTAAGTLTTLYSFECSNTCLDGASPNAGLLQATSGLFYGTTGYGGTSNDGIAFTMSTGLVPFVSFIRNPAKVDQQFGILGQGLTGTTSVLLNGAAASFTIASDTLLTATVPAGAATGYVTVTTPTGTLTSNVPFHVLP
jgi:uncharacterized repeat protein (TIGR03803 family)